MMYTVRIRNMNLRYLNGAVFSFAFLCIIASLVVSLMVNYLNNIYSKVLVLKNK